MKSFGEYKTRLLNRSRNAALSITLPINFVDRKLSRRPSTKGWKFHNHVCSRRGDYGETQVDIVSANWIHRISQVMELMHRVYRSYRRAHQSVVNCIMSIASKINIRFIETATITYVWPRHDPPNFSELCFQNITIRYQVHQIRGRWGNAAEFRNVAPPLQIYRTLQRRPARLACKISLEVLLKHT